MRRSLYPSSRLLLLSLLALTGATLACSEDSPSITPSGASTGTNGATTSSATTTAGTGSGGTAGATGSSSSATTATTSGAGGQGGAAGSSTGAGGAAGGAGDGGTGGTAGSATDGGSTADAEREGGGTSDGGDGCASALYCDNFDSYTSPGNPGGMWKTSTQPGGMVSVDTMHAFSGTKAVHVMDPGNAAYERAFISLEGAPVFPLANNTMFGRMMIYVTRRPTTTVHYSLISGEGSKVPGFPNLTAGYYRYGAQINGSQFLAQYDVQPSGQADCAQRAQVSLMLNKWSCIEWRFDGTLKEMDLWLDGTIIPALSVRQMAPNGKAACQNQNWSGIWEPPTFDAIRLGWQHYQQGPGEAWIDDVAVDTKKIGCPAAQPGAK